MRATKECLSVHATVALFVLPCLHLHSWQALFSVRPSPVPVSLPCLFIGWYMAGMGCPCWEAGSTSSHVALHHARLAVFHVSLMPETEKKLSTCPKWHVSRPWIEFRSHSREKLLRLVWLSHAIYVVGLVLLYTGIGGRRQAQVSIHSHPAWCLLSYMKSSPRNLFGGVCLVGWLTIAY